MSEAFEGKTVVLTGAGAGIGRSLAIKLAKSRARVWAIDLNEKALAELADEASKFDLDVKTRIADVTKLDALAAIRDEVTQQRQAVDYWVNNAGIARMGDFVELGPEGFDSVMAVNLTGVGKRGAQDCHDLFRDLRGCVISRYGGGNPHARSGDSGSRLSAQCVQVGDQIAELRGREFVARHRCRQTIPGRVDSPANSPLERPGVIGRAPASVGGLRQVRLGQIQPCDLRRGHATFGDASSVMSVAVHARQQAGWQRVAAGHAGADRST